MSNEWLIELLLEKFREVDASNIEAVGWYVDRLVALDAAQDGWKAVREPEKPVIERGATAQVAVIEALRVAALEEAEASVALAQDPRAQTHYAGDDCDPPHPSMDTPPDTRDPAPPETESAAVDTPLDTPRPESYRTRSKVPCIDDQRHSWPDGYDADGWQRCTRGCGAGRKREGPKGFPSVVVPPERVGALARPRTSRTTAAGSVPCVRPGVRHMWPIKPSLDGWARCIREGCGAGRRNNEGLVFSASDVPPRHVPAAAEGSPPPPPFQQAPAPAGEEAASQQPAEPPADDERAADEEPGRSPHPAVGSRLDQLEDDDEDDELLLGLDGDQGERLARGPVIDGHELAQRARPEAIRALSKLGPPCERCGEQLLTERDQDGDVEYVCINGHRRYGRSPAELAEMLAQETAAFGGKQRKRQPSINGLRLG